MRRTTGSMVLAAIFLALVPLGASGAESKFTYAGAASARVLDLDIPALQIQPSLAAAFKGLTIGVTMAEHASDPKVSGFAGGHCDYLGVNATPASACRATSRAESTATANAPQGGSATAKCEANPILPGGVVQLQAVCAKSTSDVTSGSPVGTNEGGGGLINISLNLTGILPQAEQAKDAVLDGVITVLGTVGPAIPAGQAQSVRSQLTSYLESIKGGTKAGTILNGVATTNITSAASKVSVTSTVAGLKIGLLGLTDPVVDGLIIIDVTGASALAVWDGVSGTATATANPATATLKVRDIADLIPNSDYLTSTVSVPQLANLLTPLNGTVLETSIEAATVTQKQEGRSASASTSGLRIRALKGVGASAAGLQNGGIDLRIASADASVTGTPVTSVLAALPKTGGASRAFFLGALLLALAAIPGLYVARRIRTNR